MKDPLATFLLALGFAVLLVAPPPLSITAAAMLSAALVGLQRVLGKRAPLALVGVVVALWVLQHFWDLVPIETYKFSNEHPTLYAAPAFLANVARVVLFAAIAIVARPRVGNGLTALALGALAMAVIAKGPLLVTDKDSSASLIFGAIDSGWHGVATRVVAIVFLAAAFEPKTARLEKRGLVIVAIIGASLFAAVYDTLPQHFSPSDEPFPALVTGAMALAWILSAIGFAGVARAGGGPGAWIAMALSIAQVPLFGFGLALSDKSQSVASAVGCTMFFGLLAIGVAGVSAPSMGARAARGVAGILALASLFGTLASFVYLMAGLFHVVPARDPFGPLHRLAFPIVGHAAVAWAASLAYLVAPPSDKVAS